MVRSLALSEGDSESILYAAVSQEQVSLIHSVDAFWEN